MAAVFVDLKYLCILSWELVCRAPFLLCRFSRSVSLLESARERASECWASRFLSRWNSLEKERVSNILPLFQVFIFSIHHLYVHTMETMTTIILKLSEWQLRERLFTKNSRNSTMKFR